MAYGALRAPVASMMKPLTDKIPIGNLGDNIGMGVISYFAAKSGKGFLADLGRKGLVVENALIGADISAGGFSLGGGSSTSSGNFMYG